MAANLPLGDNPVGRAVAVRFGAMSERFFASMADYLRKVDDARSALRLGAVAYDQEDVYQAHEYGETASSYAEDAVEPPAQKFPWGECSSQQLHGFATTNNRPDEVADVVRAWQAKSERLAEHSADFVGDLAKVSASWEWEGAAADAANRALAPLAAWSGHAGENVGRLRDRLENAGQAAVHVKQ